MKNAGNEKYIDFEDVESCLNCLMSLLGILHGNYFGKAPQAVEKEPFLIVHEYEQYSDLLLASVRELQDARETLEIAARNCERKTAPYYGDLSEENKAYINGQIAMLIKEQPPMGAELAEKGSEEDEQ